MAQRPLNNKQLRCIDMLIYTDKLKCEIAEELNVSNATISVWLKKEEFQEGIRAEMNRSFGSLAVKAKKRLEQLIDSTNEQVALSASREALNKAGYQETQKIEQDIKTDISIEITDW